MVQVALVRRHPPWGRYGHPDRGRYRLPANRDFDYTLSRVSGRGMPGRSARRAR